METIAALRKSWEFAKWLRAEIPKLFQLVKDTFVLYVCSDNWKWRLAIGLKISWEREIQERRWYLKCKYSSCLRVHYCYSNKRKSDKFNLEKSLCHSASPPPPILFTLRLSKLFVPSYETDGTEMSWFKTRYYQKSPNYSILRMLLTIYFPVQKSLWFY